MMSQKYQFHFVIDESYYDSIYHASMQKVKKIARFPLILFLWIFLIYLDSEAGCDFGASIFILFGITGVAVLYVTRKRAKVSAARIERVARKDPMLGNKMTVSFGEEWIEVKDAAGERSVEYQSITRLSKTQEYYIVRTKQCTIAVPIRLLESEEIKKFESFVKQKTNLTIKDYSYIKPYVMTFQENIKARRAKSWIQNRISGLAVVYIIMFAITVIVILILQFI